MLYNGRVQKRSTRLVSMKVVQTEIAGVVIIEPRLFGDQRGFFYESFRVDRYAPFGIAGPFVQDNVSRSARGVLRGLHLQNPKSQGKLITALHGQILDVAVDVRRGSPTFGQHVAVDLSEDNRRQFWVPRGFAHGFLVRSDMAEIHYKCDDYYSPSDELTIRWNDPAIGIAWEIESPVLSTRDAAAPLLSEISTLPVYGQI